jgi:GMP synthase-like glutamine amidotransferase
MTEAGKADPLLGGLGDVFTTFQWRRDNTATTRMPSCNELSCENRAFRVGRAAYGTQFHFEPILTSSTVGRSNSGQRSTARNPAGSSAIRLLRRRTLQMPTPAVL